ncbi:MAG: hypothetical protein RIC24_17090 [Hyphomicrobiales bacterium]|jgi:lysophospholipid acyltransferase (LPLAT)-like uncharacterized protein
MTLPATDEGAQNKAPSLEYSDWRARLVGKIGALLLNLLALTWRSDASQLARVDEQIASGVPVVAVFWHSSYLSLFALARGRPVTVFTSQSFRGKIIASICHAFGYAPSLLPPGRQGYHHMRKVLRDKRHDIEQSVLVGIAVDGPLGPRHRVKPGALHIAARMGALVMPIQVTSHPNWTIRRRWDRFKIPLPFARVILRVGPPIRVRETFGSDQEEVVELRQRVHDRLNGETVSVG